MTFQTVVVASVLVIILALAALGWRRFFARGVGPGTTPWIGEAIKASPQLAADPLLKLVDTWAAEYNDFCLRSQRRYYWFTAIALVATSLVTATGGIGGWLPAADAHWFLIATTLLGLVATVATGLDKLFNDRKDYIRAARYKTLFDIEMFKYVFTAAQSGSTPEQKTFVDAISKLRSDELSDWIQDETSATVDILAATSGKTDGVAVLQAEAAAGAARQREREATDAVNAARKALELADHDHQAAVEAYESAVTAKVDQTTLDSLKERVDEKQTQSASTQTQLTNALDAEKKASKAVEDAEADVVRRRSPGNDGSIRGGTEPVSQK